MGGVGDDGRPAVSDVVVLYTAGLPSRVVGELLGLSASCVLRRLRRAGVERRPPGGAPRGGWIVVSSPDLPPCLPFPGARLGLSPDFPSCLTLPGALFGLGSVPVDPRLRRERVRVLVGWARAGFSLRRGRPEF